VVSAAPTLTPEELEEQTVRRLSVLDKGVIYQDGLAQISMKSQFASGKGKKMSQNLRNLRWNFGIF
jgi:hypothetical protein